MATPSILDAYMHTAPVPQNAIDLFKGEWSSRFPPPFGELAAGGIPLFQDSRIAWALQELGGITGQNVLELGPLEGGHSYMLEQAGAAHVQSIEANSRAYLKCLISKEILGMKNVQYQLGDFIPFLEETQQQYDMILSAGVLYHMKDPLKLLRLVSQHTSRTYIWTHYYDKSIIQGDSNLRVKFPSNKPAEVEGRSFTFYRQEYQSSLQGKTYCGGNEEFSHWLSRKDLLDALTLFGFKKLTIGHEMPQHPHGPCLGVVAVK